jgi:hypothetical protein
MINENPYTGHKFGAFEILHVIGGEPIVDNDGTIIGHQPMTWKCSINMRSSDSYSGIFDIKFNDLVKATR